MDMGSVIFSTWGDWHSSGGHVEPEGLPKAFGQDGPLKAFMGWGGVFVRDASVNLVDMARAYMEAAKKESCGQCFPCRLGTEQLCALLARICQGEGAEEDVDRLEHLARYVMESARCNIGQTAPRPLLDLLSYRREDFLSVIESGEPVPEGRYAVRVTAPCTNACPSHLDIPGYVEKIRFGRTDDSLGIVLRDCPLPGTIGRVCVRPCESNCRRALLDEPISIKYLKRFAADEERAAGNAPAEKAAAEKKEKVAIIGAGPAGLSCAYYLGLRGYKATIFESLPEPGGMAAVGIPDYRLPRPVLRGEVARMERLGAEIRYNVNVGRDISLADLTKQGYKAVFIGVGAPESSEMRCEGEDAGYQCFMTGVEFLRRVAFGERPIEGKKILVIGGGNVAMDCVRSALRLGFTDVNLVYRRTEAEMPADPSEVQEAREEGVKIHFLLAPVRIHAKEGKVTGLECQKMELGEPDESGRRRPVPIEGSNFIIETDAIVPAIGQICVVDCVLPEKTQAEMTRYKTLVVDEMTFQSGEPHIFGGGDCITGPATLIGALAAGKKAAAHIAQYLETGKCQPSETDWMEKTFETLGVYDEGEKMPFPGHTRCAHPPVLDPEVRIQSFDEVEATLSPSQAVHEAERCLRCYRIGMVAV